MTERKKEGSKGRAGGGDEGVDDGRRQGNGEGEMKLGKECRAREGGGWGKEKEREEKWRHKRVNGGRMKGRTDRK